MSTVKFDKWENSDGTENYKCRAWASFDGYTMSLGASKNISSVVDNGTGDYSINFSTAMPDKFYAFSVKSTEHNLSWNRIVAPLQDSDIDASYLRVHCAYTSNWSSYVAEDQLQLSVAIFR